MSIEIETIVIGPLETNCYVLRGEQDCWIVDPGLGASRVIELLRRSGSAPSRILLTHGHADHIAGVEAVRSAFPGIRLCCPEGDVPLLSDPAANMSAAFGMPITVGPPDEVVPPGQVLTLDGTPWLAMDTSGHTPGGLSYYADQAAAVLTGDSLFAGSIGRTDIPGASTAVLLQNLHEKLLPLPDETRVLPGHGPESTIGAERAANPFLRGA